MATRPPWPRQGRRRQARRRRCSGSPARTTASVHLPPDERGDLELVQLGRERRGWGGARAGPRAAPAPPPRAGGTPPPPPPPGTPPHPRPPAPSPPAPA